MPTYRVQAPDGKTYRVQAGSEQEAMSGLRATLDAEKRRPANKFTDQATRSASLGLSDPVNAGISALVSQAPRLVGKDPGYGLREAYNAAKSVEAKRGAEYDQANPGKSLGAGLLGGLAMPGGKLLAKAATPVAKGLLGGLEAVGRGAGIGGALGGAYGALTANPGEMAQGAKRGAVTGAVTGGALPVAGAAVGKVAQGAGGAARTVARAANKASGGQILNPTREAGKRLVEAMRKDGMTPDAIKAVQNQWMKTGVNPTLLDVVSANGGGQNTRALLRGAALQGEGRNTASKYANQVTSDLQDNAIGLTRNLTPDTRPVGAVREALEAERSATAQQLYPTFQGDAVPVQAFGDALTGRAGQVALARARNIADTMRDVNAVTEIDAILAGQADTVSAGTLDLIRRGLRDAGQKAKMSGDNTVASGLAGRGADLETALMDVPGFDAARNAFRQQSQGIDALDLGATGLRATPDEFAAKIGALPETALDPARIGYRDAITQQIGNPTEGATGFLNRLGTSTNQGRNLATAFGDEPAQNYRGGIQNLVEQVQNARFIDPGTNSQSVGRALDERLVEGAPNLPRSPFALVVDLIDKIRAGATLTDQERNAVVQLGLADALPEDLAILLQQQAQRQAISPRLAPAAALAAQNYQGAQ